MLKVNNLAGFGRLIPAAGGATPTYEGVGTLSYVETGTLTVNMPTHAANDILLCMVGNATGAALVNSAGSWTEITQGGSLRHGWWWKRAVDGSTSSPQFTGDAYIYGAIYVIRGCVTSGDPFEDATATYSSTNDPLSASIDTTGNSRLAMCFLQRYLNSAVSSYPPATWTNNSNLTASDAAGGTTFIAMSKSIASAANVPQVTIGTITGSKFWGSMTLAFIPA